MNTIPDIVKYWLQKHYSRFNEIYLDVFSLLQETEQDIDIEEIGKKTYHHTLWKTKSIFIYETFTQTFDERKNTLIIYDEKNLNELEYRSIYSFFNYHWKEESLNILDQLRIEYIPTMKQYLYLEYE